ncbi:hypothetical protein H2202_010921 [Exophiala xenobiotica]|nr:hypothetical protein H2202_010921 [Exophiala xenobiotica]KAK5188760.1 hypothetical protein LTR92_011237 [Exophiala xenobiotica]KAK5202440.1 hypothetical protein LTR41_011809 [Exophiala xenobiotica]KAK5214650.1 hypothetical protein LTR72_012196 [Exophiala xenobiotica]KAK5218843.1 hypothetical protein LTR47_011654 [Exophiala xenobiotica]
MRNNTGGIIQRLITMQHIPVPPIGRIVTAGFSAGVGGIKELLISAGNHPRGRPDPPRAWSMEALDPYQSSPVAFIEAWQEIWDMDGSREVLDSNFVKGADPEDYRYLIPWSGLLASWQRQQDSRLVRVYRTAFTVREKSKMTTFDKILGRSTLTDQLDPWRSNQRAGDRGSWVVFPPNYFVGKKPAAGDKTGGADGNSPGRPEFWNAGDDHQVVPSVCFAHAAGNSGLRKLVF